MTPTSVGGEQQISISGGSQSPIGYSLWQDCRDAQKKYVMHCMTRISQQECRGILESIWLCLNQIDDSLQYIYFTKEELKGKMTWKGRMKIPNIIMIGLSKKLPEVKKENMLHRFLGTLLSNQLEAQEKIEILEKEYGFLVEEKMKGEINSMCNLSQGIRESGRVEGRIEGENCAMKLIEKLMAKGRMEDCHRVIKDGAYRRQLMQEFNIR